MSPVLTLDVRVSTLVRPRSIIPGRQRWDVPMLRGRADVGVLLEVALHASPGVEVVRANPITGRLLAIHDDSLSSEEMSRLVHEAAAEVDLSGPEAPALVSSGNGRHGRPDRVHPIVALTRARAAAGAAAAGVALVGTILLPFPLLRLGAVLTATAIVVRQGWRRSARSRQSPAMRDRAIRHPVLRIVRSHKRRFYRASALVVLAQVLFLAPIVMLRSIQATFSGSNAFLMGLGLHSVASQIWFVAGAASIVCIAFFVVSRASVIMWNEVAQGVQHEWRTEMFSHLQKTQVGYLEEERTTRLARVLSDDVEQLGRFLAGPAPYLFRISTTLGVLMLLFVWGAPTVAWIAFLPVPLIAWLSFRYQADVGPHMALAGHEGALLNSQLINTLEANATVKSFGGEAFEIERIRRLSNGHRRSTLWIQRRTATYNQTVIACALLSLAGTYLLGGLDVLTGIMTVAIYNTLIGLPQLLSFQLPGFGEAVEQYQRTVSALRRVLDLRDLPVEPDDGGLSLDVADIAGQLILENVTFAYPGRAPVLENLSLRIEARKTTGIVGATGAGKTTIAKLLLRLHDVAAGRVLLDGVDVRELKLRDLRAAIGFVSQEAFLFDGTVGENICYGSFDADAERMTHAAETAKAADFIDALPLKYETIVGERGVALSGGQKQRISLARAIVKSAPIVVLDEATSSVDNETEAAIQSALGNFANKRTMLIIAHRLSMIRHADWIYVIGEVGTVVEEGTHDDLLRNNAMYATLWRLQAGEAS